MSLEYVIDASVAIKLFINEPLSDKADRLFVHLTADPPAILAVPDLFYIECANILWKHVTRYGYPATSAMQDLQDLNKLSLQSTPAYDLAREALQIALTHTITAYDACYIALAQRLKVPCVTADEKLVRKLAATSLSIVWLGDLDVPPLP